MPAGKVQAIVSEILGSHALPEELFQNLDEQTGLAVSMNRLTNASSVLPSYTMDQLRLQQEADPQLVALTELNEAGWEPGGEITPELRAKVGGYLREWDRLVFQDGVWFRKYKDKASEETLLQLLIPEGMKKEILNMAHDRWGHQGVDRTLKLVKMRCYFPGLDHWVRQHIKKCDRCI